MTHTTPTSTVTGHNLFPGEWIVVDVPTVQSGTAGLTTGRWPCRIVATQPHSNGQILIAGIVTTRKGVVSWQCVIPAAAQVESLPKHHAICRKCHQLAPCHDELVTQDLTAALESADTTPTEATDQP